MKKFIGTMLVCGIAATAFTSGVYADEMTLGTKNTEKYSVSVNGANVDLGKSTVYTSGENIMVPLRAVAEKLGFTVEWNEKNQEITLDDKEVNTRLEIGTDNYYMSSSKAIGMSAPTALGSAPVLNGDTTYVPAKMFDILCGEGTYSVSGNAVDFTKEKNAVQIPNPLTEYKTVDEAKKRLPFKAPDPEAFPDGYKISYVGTISDNTLQIFCSNGKNEIVYRVAEGDGDISGDYNVYKDEKTVKINGIDVKYRENGETSGAKWTKDGLTFSVFADTVISEKDVETIISSIK